MVFLIPHRLSEDPGPAIASLHPYPALALPDTERLGPGFQMCRALMRMERPPEYIGNLDADDLCADVGVVGRMLDRMRRDPLASIIYADYNEGGHVSEDEERNEGIGLRIWRTSSLLACGGFNPTIRIAYDFDLLLRLPPPRLVHLEIATIRGSHPGQLTNNRTPRDRALIDWIGKRPP